MIETKKCRMCEKVLPIDNFSRATKEGYRRGECNSCRRIINFIKRKHGRTEDDYWKYQNEIKEKEKLHEEGKRKCGCCGEIKLLSEFNKSKSGVGGYQPNCRGCTKVKWKEYYEDNSKKLKTKRSVLRHEERSPEQQEKYLAEKAYVEELHLLQKEGKRRCRICKTIKILDEFPSDSSSRVYYKKKTHCKCCGMEVYQKPYRATDRGRAKKSVNDKKYNSKPSVKKRRNERTMERYNNDPAFKIKHLMRTRINKVVDRKKQSKKFTQEVGCTFDELVVYLESQFYSDPRTGEMMTWDNHTVDGWHIDHKKPLHEFDLEDDEQFNMAAHYTNLQPLWWWQNLEKNRGIVHNK